MGRSGLLVHNATECLGIVNQKIEQALSFSFTTPKAKESLISLLREAGFGDNIAGLATYKNLLSQFKDDVSFLKALQGIPATHLPTLLSDCQANTGLIGLLRQTNADQNHPILQAWNILRNRGNFRTTPDKLQSVAVIMSNSNISRDNLRLAIDNATTGSVPYLNGSDAISQLEKFSQKEKIESVVNYLASTGSNFRKGGGYVLRALKDKPAEYVSQFEFKYVTDRDFAADVLTNTNMKVDMKSYDLVNTIDVIGARSMPEQLKTYFQNPPFELWFDLKRFGEYRNMLLLRKPKHWCMLKSNIKNCLEEKKTNFLMLYGIPPIKKSSISLMLTQMT